MRKAEKKEIIIGNGAGLMSLWEKGEFNEIFPKISLKVFICRQQIKQRNCQIHPIAQAHIMCKKRKKELKQFILNHKFHFYAKILMFYDHKTSWDSLSRLIFMWNIFSFRLVRSASRRDKIAAPNG